MVGISVFQIVYGSSARFTNTFGQDFRAPNKMNLVATVRESGSDEDAD